MKASKLTAKQQLFVAEYLIDRNATQAAIRAGYSSKTAYSIGEENLRKPELRRLIDASLAKMLNKLEITTERTLLERARLSFYDMGDIAKANPQSPADIAKMDPDLRNAIVGWKYDAAGRFIPELADKATNLTALDKHQGLYGKDNEQKRTQIMLNMDFRGQPG